MGLGFRVWGLGELSKVPILVWGFGFTAFRDEVLRVRVLVSGRSSSRSSFWVFKFRVLRFWVFRFRVLRFWVFRFRVQGLGFMVPEALHHTHTASRVLLSLMQV